MKRNVLVLALAFAVLAGWLTVTRFVHRPTSVALGASAGEGAVLAEATVAAAQSTPGKSGALPGELILRGYAQTNLPPQNDLTLMSHLMENFALLLKSAANRPLSANEDWAAALRGKNAARERFLGDNHAAFNNRGQIVDRWDTPLFFHALGEGRYELRSAGPDRRMWTEDDIHRNADGSFRQGAELGARDLLESARHKPEPRAQNGRRPGV